MKIKARHLKEKMLYNPYMLDLDRASRVDSEKYRYYMSLISCIREILDESGINIKCKGYLYIQDCIVTIFDQRRMNINFKNDVYPYVASKYRVRYPANIEHSIRNAIRSAYDRGLKNDSLPDIYRNFGKCPSNKEFLLYLTAEAYERLWREPVEFARH